MESNQYFLRAVTVLAKDSGYIVTSRGEKITIERASAPDGTHEKIINHLNSKNNSSFRSDSKATQGLINRLCSAGYEASDLMKVIDAKVADWKNDTRMAQYLRPQTLFNFNKFENYLYAANVKPKATMHDLLKDDWQ